MLNFLATAAASAFGASQQRKAEARQFEYNKQLANLQWDRTEAESARNRDFQKEMSSTAYQRAMADMRAGGLNPILAYSQGGASTPSGSMASHAGAGSVRTDGSAAIKGASAYAMLRNMHEQNRNLSAQRGEIQARTRLLGEQARATAAAANIAELGGDAAGTVRDDVSSAVDAVRNLLRDAGRGLGEGVGRDVETLRNIGRGVSSAAGVAREYWRMYQGWREENGRRVRSGRPAISWDDYRRAVDPDNREVLEVVIPTNRRRR